MIIPLTRPNRKNDKNRLLIESRVASVTSITNASYNQRVDSIMTQFCPLTFYWMLRQHPPTLDFRRTISIYTELFQIDTIFCVQRSESMYRSRATKNNSAVRHTDIWIPNFHHHEQTWNLFDHRGDRLIICPYQYFFFFVTVLLRWIPFVSSWRQDPKRKEGAGRLLCDISVSSL